MMAYWNAVMSISAQFEGLEFHHVQHDSIQAADIFAKFSAWREPVPKNTFLERLFKPSIKWQGDPEPDTQDDVSTPELVVPVAIEPDDAWHNGGLGARSNFFGT